MRSRVYAGGSFSTPSAREVKHRLEYEAAVGAILGAIDESDNSSDGGSSEGLGFSREASPDTKMMKRIGSDLKISEMLDLFGGGGADGSGLSTSPPNAPSLLSVSLVFKP